MRRLTESVEEIARTERLTPLPVEGDDDAVGGVEMFVRQAAAQFQAWTGTPAPADVMRNVVERRLSAPPKAPA